MRADLRHPYEPKAPIRNRDAAKLTTTELTACRCGKAKRNPIHRLGSRCSVCFRFFRHYELDSSRRCDTCRG